ncbi:MAG: fused MFS/spermidine synthase [Candidatus Aminicenantes bacterium]|uniref:Polyamine aminopropyltransferase n=1 Tax=Candidatus Saccharicenans subterraneus TaxID=2508984 RepID=A0A3E2BJB5_9BACT|nr:fused MFS/spermidine synthase [Candidatus Aminicenantes bacterium]RFT14831.1 MAG: Spermidine synthase [Candidatus Saccharicenans subterraneum]
MPLLRSGHCRGLELKNSFWPFLLGFLATSFQVIILREFEVRFQGNELVYGLVLAFWLLGGGLGSLLAEKKFQAEISPVVFYRGMIIITAALLVLLRLARFAFGTLPAEMTGPGPLLLTSWLISFALSLPLGALFVFNVFWQRGRLVPVYQLESLGAAAGGLLVYLVLTPHLSSWQAAALISLLAGLAINLVAGSKQMVSTVITVLVAAGLWFGDRPTEKFYWKPLHLVEVRDSPYARLQVVRTGELVSFYVNSSLAFNFPDPASAEEAIHFAFLQRPEATRLLLIGGGLNGTLAQALQYPRVRVDYVELDPALVRLARQVLPDRQTGLEDPRVTINLQDGRKFLRATRNRYDLIICNLPEPATAQVNRFYTVEFFRQVREKLAEDGVFSFLLPSSESYLSPQRTILLATIYHSLLTVFPRVEIIPGDNNILLASAGPLDITTDSLLEKLDRYQLKTVFFRPEFLRSRLHPLKREYLRSSLQTVDSPRLNSDRLPVSYFYQTLVWSQQFHGPLSRGLGQLQHQTRFWLFDLPLFLFMLLIMFLIAFRKKGGTIYLLPITVMGFTTIVAEVALILAFQSRLGLVYGKISLLFTIFMAGLFLGSSLARRLSSTLGPRHLVAVQTGFVILLALAGLAPAAAPEPAFYGLLLVMGFLGGFLFVVSNFIYLQSQIRYGLGYSLDLFGSFLGALLATSVFIPLLGLELLFTFLLLVNSFCLGFILFRLYVFK